MIASFIEGRVRLRANALKNPEKLKQLEDAVKAHDGVLGTFANPRTGSLLVEYDPTRVPKENLLMAAELLKQELGLAPEAKKEGKKLVQLMNPKAEMALLTGSLAFTMLGGVVNKRLHLAAGGLFLLACAGHLYSRGRRFPLPAWLASAKKPRCGCAKKRARNGMGERVPTPHDLAF